jgi:hypothetical protein
MLPPPAASSKASLHALPAALNDGMWLNDAEWLKEPPRQLTVLLRAPWLKLDREPNEPAAPPPPAWGASEALLPPAAG